MEKLGVNLGYLIFQILNFSIVCILLYAWAYKPILNMMDKRKTKIAQGLEDARVASEARANAEQDAAKIMAEAQAKASQVVHEASEHAEAVALEIRAPSRWTSIPSACAPSTTVSTPRAESSATRRSIGNTSAVGLVT